MVTSVKTTATSSASGIASGREMPPRRRATRAIRNASGNANSAYQGMSFHRWGRGGGAEWGGYPRPHLALVHPAGEDRVEEEDLAARAEPRRERVLLRG